MKAFFIALLTLCSFNFSQIVAFQIFQQTPKNESIGYDNCMMSENGEQLLLKSFLKPNAVVFDVGANVGEWTSHALTMQPDISIHSFEPIPDIYKILATKFSHYKVSAYNLAMSDEIGKTKFYFYDDGVRQHSELSGFYNRDILRDVLHFQEPKVIQVEQDTLDHFCETHKINAIDFLKIDTEGAEWKVLLGARRLLQEQKIAMIQFEYGGCYKDAKTTLKQVLQLLTSYEYEIFRIVPGGLLHISTWSDSLETMRYSNYFALLKPKASIQFSLIDNLGEICKN